jgi:twitching motility two-component system response regulator PilH
VLIVDPDEADRQRLCSVVARVAKATDSPLEVVEARDGTTAMALLSEKPFRLVLAEAILEGISGLALLRALGKRDKGPPVVLVTRMTRETDRYWGLRNGALAYVPKPFDETALCERIERILTDPKVRSERPVKL